MFRSWPSLLMLSEWFCRRSSVFIVVLKSFRWIFSQSFLKTFYLDMGLVSFPQGRLSFLKYRHRFGNMAFFKKSVDHCMFFFVTGSLVRGGKHLNLSPKKTPLQKVGARMRQSTMLVAVVPVSSSISSRRSSSSTGNSIKYCTCSISSCAARLEHLPGPRRITWKGWSKCVIENGLQTINCRRPLEKLFHFECYQVFFLSIPIVFHQQTQVRFSCNVRPDS